jgi:hypothetical protein
MVFLFNVGGYYFVFWVLLLHADHQINYQLDANQYNPDETVELKIPVALPYPIQSQGFERVNGRFEHHGEFYRLVKHKLQNDTLYIVCIKDRQTRELVNTMNDYEELTQVPETSQKAWNFISKLIKDFCPDDTFTIARQFGLTMNMYFSDVCQTLPQPFIPVPGHPPQA